MTEHDDHDRARRTYPVFGIRVHRAEYFRSKINSLEFSKSKVARDDIEMKREIEAAV
jgi:hypothetical protein